MEGPKGVTALENEEYIEKINCIMDDANEELNKSFYLNNDNEMIIILNLSHIFGDFYLLNISRVFE